jgi:hypothetical protein
MASKKYSIDAQIEEVTMALDDYRFLQIKPSKIEFRSDRLRSALATLRWVKENGDVLKALVRLKNIQQQDPEAFERALEASSGAQG